LIAERREDHRRARPTRARPKNPSASGSSSACAWLSIR